MSDARRRSEPEIQERVERVDAAACSVLDRRTELDDGCGTVYTTINAYRSAA
jgi:hypothetical protein